MAAKLTNKSAVVRALSELTDRVEAASKLGYSFSGNRDLYANLGWVREPNYRDHIAQYRRNGIGRAVVTRPVGACWREQPGVMVEGGDKEFETAWKALVTERRVFHYLQRVDRLSRIGTHSALLMGFDDGAPTLDVPLAKGTAKRLLYMTVCSEEGAAIAELVLDSKDPRFGMPLFYTVKVRGSTTASTRSVRVHWSRMIHVVEDPLTDDVIGEPAMSVVLNYLMDLDKLVGGSAEMFWQGAFPGFAFKLDAGATAETQDLDDVKDQIFNFIHKFQRWLRLQGIDVQSLAPQVADPGPHVAAQVDMISAATGLPKRILLGSERGELASSEDKDNWADQTKDRQSNICEPVILRPFIDRMMFAGVLPEVEYVIQWPDPSAPDDAARAEVGSKRAMSLAAYVNALGSDRIIPPEAVPEVLLGMTADQAATLTEGIEAADAEEAATEAADKETVEGAGDEPEA